MKITSGKFRGIALNSPDGENVRPTLAKTRQAVFNMLRPYLDGAVVADFFAGTGAYGFEALSNGASKVVFVDRGNRDLISRNAAKLKLQPGSWEHLCADFRQAAGSLKGLKASIIIADPPYNAGFIKNVLNMARLSDILDKEGIAIMELHESERSEDGLRDELLNWNILREKRYGETVVLALDLKKSAA